jgi:tetratricopeptide (TPR) repeat protein
LIFILEWLKRFELFAKAMLIEGCMKQTQFDKHTIAWFKIADCVSRGEKERALGVYRLLSHSFNDNAVARQLEADIYCSFGDIEQAIPLYQQAMEFYYKSQRFLEAAAVGEHLIAVHSDDMELRRTMVQLYIFLNMVVKLKEQLQVLVDFLAQKQQWYDIKMLIADCARLTNFKERIGIYVDLIISIYRSGYPWDIVTYGIEQALEDVCVIDSEKKCLQEFLVSLQVVSDELYEHAVAHISK